MDSNESLVLRAVVDGAANGWTAGPVAADAVPDEVRVIVRDELAHNGFPMDASAFVCRRHAIGGWVFAFASLEADHVIFLMVYALDDLPELQRHVTLRPLVGRAKQRLSG